MKDFQNEVLAVLNRDSFEGIQERDFIIMDEIRDDLCVLDMLLTAYVDSTECYPVAYAFMRSIINRDADEHFSELDNEELELLSFCTSLIIIPDDPDVLYSYDGIDNVLNDYIDDHCSDILLSDQLRKKNTFEELKKSFLHDYNEYNIGFKRQSYFYR